MTASVRRFRFAITLAACSFIPMFAFAEGVPREQCFPVERLEPRLRARAEELLLKMLDSEALYTIVGGLKPVSGSFWTTRFAVDSPDLSRLDETRRVLATFRCGESYQAEVLVFASVIEGKRHGHAWIAHRPTVRRALAAHAAFFAPYGISLESPPIEVIEKMEHAPRPDRLRASGYLFGYPDHAVDFFVEAESQRAGSEDKKPGPRDFLSAPTFSAATHKFVWAVPKGHTPNEADRAILDRVEPILAEYRRRRELYIGAGKPGVVALLRDWFDDGYGRCAPENAQFGPPAAVPCGQPHVVTTVPAPSLWPPAIGIATPIPTMVLPASPPPCLVPLRIAPRVLHPFR